MTITIIYDNTVWEPALTPDWGFACLVETTGQSLLFDTGAKGDILLGNMERLDIDPLAIDAVFISHGHGDHIGGLADFLRLNPAHCTQHIEDIKRRYPEKNLAAGAGRVVAV